MKKAQYKINALFLEGYMKGMDLTRKELCRICNLSPATLNKILRGQPVRESTMKKFLAKFNIKPPYLIEE